MSWDYNNGRNGNLSGSSENLRGYYQHQAEKQRRERQQAEDRSRRERQQREQRSYEERQRSYRQANIDRHSNNHPPLFKNSVKSSTPSQILNSNRRPLAPPAPVIVGDGWAGNTPQRSKKELAPGQLTGSRLFVSRATIIVLIALFIRAMMQVFT